MDQTISTIETFALRVPLDIWALAPMSQGVPLRMLKAFMYA